MQERSKIHQNTGSSIWPSSSGLDLLLTFARANAQATKSPNTSKAYAGDWSRFTSWCNIYNLCSLPADPETIALYLVDLANSGKKVTTIQRAISSIAQAHKKAGYFQSPTSAPQVKQVIQGIRRTIGTGQRQAKPLLPEHLHAAFEKMSGDDLRSIRNRSLLTLGLAGGLQAVGADRAELRRLGLCIKQGPVDYIQVIKKSPTLWRLPSYLPGAAPGSLARSRRYCLGSNL